MERIAGKILRIGTGSSADNTTPTMIEFDVGIGSGTNRPAILIPAYGSDFKLRNQKGDLLPLSTARVFEYIGFMPSGIFADDSNKVYAAKLDDLADGEEVQIIITENIPDLFITIKDVTGQFSRLNVKIRVQNQSTQMLDDSIYDFPLSADFGVWTIRGNHNGTRFYFV